jgi:nucleotide-binding universal stress UspA family protein
LWARIEVFLAFGKISSSIHRSVDFQRTGQREAQTAPSELEYTPIEYKKHTEGQAEKVLGTVSAAARSAGVACETLHVEHDHIYQAIIDAASARRCDLIVMASHGRRGVSAVVLGSETVKVNPDPAGRLRSTLGPMERAGP